MKLFTLPYCDECGGARVAHGPEKMSQVLEDALAKVIGQRRSSACEKNLDRIVGTLFSVHRRYALIRALTTLGLGHLTTALPPDATTRTIALYEGAQEAGVTLTTWVVFGLSLAHIAEYKGARIMFRMIPRPEGPRADSYYFMDNKELLKEFLLQHHLPCAAGGCAATLEEARSIMKRIGRAVITKPHRGSRGRHTTINIKTEEELAHGFKVASVLSPRVIVEAYLKGTVHRVTLIGGIPVAIAKREYPFVVGDGLNTIDVLIDTENKNPLRDGTFFKSIEKTGRLDHVLREQGYTRSSIPPLHTRVLVNDKNSRLNGTVTEDVTDVVHPANLALFTQIGAILNDPVVGIDFMIEDMTRPWTEQPDAGILECNSMPFIDVHHRVVSGRTINVGALLWKEVFKRV